MSGAGTGPSLETGRVLSVDAVAVLAVAASMVTSLPYDSATRFVGALAVSMVAGGVLLGRRSRPLEVFGVLVAAMYVVLATDWVVDFVPFALVAGYSLGEYGQARRVVVGIVVACLGVVPAAAARSDGPETALLVGEVVTALVLVTLLGVVVAERRRRGLLARERSLALARAGGRDLERALLAERLGMARELHDVVMNGLTAVTVQAASARRLAPEWEAEAGAALETIEETSRGATADLRRMLGALRSGGGTAVDVGAGPTARMDADEPPQWPVDLALGLSLMLVNVAGSLVPDPAGYDKPVLPALVVLAALPGLALVFRRRWPVAVFAMAVAVLVCVLALNWPDGTLPASLIVAAYALGAWAPPGRGAAALAGLFAVMLGFAALDTPNAREGSPFDLLLFVAPWLVGVVIRSRRLADARVVAETLAKERAQAVATERALAHQRLAVARELHDLIAHDISAITLQAAAARRTAPAGPVHDALGRIEEVAREALTTLRRMLDVLTGGAPVSDLAPAPGLRELEQLVDRHRAVHGAVRLEIDPGVEHEQESIRMTTYRLVQEALTNIAKHADGAPARVSIRSTPDGVVVEVTDDGIPIVRTPTRTGYGLAGMRERVAIIGGSLRSEQRPEGGYLVRAELTRETPV